MDPQTVETVDEEGNTLKTIHYRGHVFIESFPMNPETRLDAIEAFKCRTDDIIICSYPKSGLHWTNNIVLMMTTGDFSYKGSPNFLEYQDFEFFEQMASPRVYCFHQWFDLLPKEARENKCRIIHMTRNPKDVLVSYFEFCLRLTLDVYRGTFNGYHRFFLSNKFLFGNWFNYERNWNLSHNKNPDHKILQLYYEDMKADLFKCLKSINEFLELGRSKEFLKELQEHVTFENLKKEHEIQSHYVGSDLTEFMTKDAGVLPVYRKGIVGDWKNYLTVAQSESIDKMYAEVMGDCTLRLTYE